MNAIYRTVGAISLRTQYNLQRGYYSEILLTGKSLRQSHWTPVNMTEYVIERYNNFNTKGYPEDLFVVLIINPSHPPTLISQMIMITMALQLTLPYQKTK